MKLLILEYNLLEGVIPASVYHCQTLQVISLATNKLRGVLPKYRLSNLTSLQLLFLGENNFTGTIPPPLVNNSKLVYLGLDYNNLHGRIPNEIGYLKNLKVLDLEANNLNGTIPSSIFNISSLQTLALELNSLSGTLPSTFGLQLPNLRKLYLSKNQLSGSIPSYLSNCSQLTRLELSFNQFIGPVPAGLGHLENLQVLYLGANQLENQPGSLELSFLTELTRCISLKSLDIGENPFSGHLLDSFGNLSSSLQSFYAVLCNIKGPKIVPIW